METGAKRQAGRGLAALFFCACVSSCFCLLEVSACWFVFLFCLFVCLFACLLYCLLARFLFACLVVRFVFFACLFVCCCFLLLFVRGCFSEKKEVGLRLLKRVAFSSSSERTWRQKRES